MENKIETYVRKQLHVAFFPWQGKMALAYRVQEVSHYMMKPCPSGLRRGVVVAFSLIVSLLRIVYAFACQHLDWAGQLHSHLPASQAEPWLPTSLWVGTITLYLLSISTENSSLVSSHMLLFMVAGCFLLKLLCPYHGKSWLLEAGSHVFPHSIFW